MAKATTIQDAKEQLVTLLGTVKKIESFRIPDTVRTNINMTASHLEKGDEQNAVRAANEAINGLHAIFGAFIRNAFLDRVVSDNGIEISRKSYFSRQLEEREGEKYDEDLLAGLKSKFNKAVEAVHTETNGTFENRVEAYTMVHDALKAADDEQKKRDRKRAVIAENNRRAMKNQADAEATERNLQHTTNQRQLMLERRKQEADAFRSLI
ncbi:MAG TPA: hypothetical protein VFX17_00805 [Patescibacteria group bacterium]|nr:hypothetical protein [Patescibacteria group bacterium]